MGSGVIGSPGDFGSSSSGSSPGSPVAGSGFKRELKAVLCVRKHVRMPGHGPRYTETEARAAIAVSISYAEALRRLGMRAAGGNHSTLRKYAEQIWRIPVDHFDPDRARDVALRRRSARPLEEILVAGSTFSRGHLKERLFRAGIKARRCELCGQGEIWRGAPMALILDHINGVANDHRLENLRIVCPNCAATLDTHCGRQNRRELVPRRCPTCTGAFWPSRAKQRFCGRSCASRRDRSSEGRPVARKVPRPPYNHLLREVASIGYAATGRRYGVSDNAIRKWLRRYEREHAEQSRSHASRR